MLCAAFCTSDNFYLGGRNAKSFCEKPAQVFIGFPARWWCSDLNLVAVIAVWSNKFIATAFRLYIQMQ